MNAKVKISEQIVPFYSAADVISAYSLALDTTTQIQTLIDRIRKNVVFLKSTYKNDIRSTTFDELESLISIARYLSDDFSNTFDAQCEKHQNIVVEYDARDLLEVYSLAHEVHSWLSSTIYEMKVELSAIKKSSTALCDAVFASVENLINIADYLSDNYRNTFKIECEKYEAEWRLAKMTNTPHKAEHLPVLQDDKVKPLPSHYVESVKMTPQRLMNAVANNKNRQGGSSEH